MRGLSSILTSILPAAAEDPEVVLIFLKELWPLLVGDSLAARSRPARLHGKSLTVHLSDEVWKNQLEEEELRVKLRSAINTFWKRRLVEKIVLRVGT